MPTLVSRQPRDTNDKVQREEIFVRADHHLKVAARRLRVNVAPGGGCDATEIGSTTILVLRRFATGDRRTLELGEVQFDLMA